MMKKALLAFLGIAFICLIAVDANADPNEQAKWALHYAGVHNAKTNTCAFTMTDCREATDGEMVSVGPAGPGRFDIYVMALDTDAVAGTRYGICCPEGGFYFYGWTKCSDLELPSAGWPGCGEGNAQTWAVAEPAGHVTIGILDVYVYAGTGKICVCDDPRVAYSEWCDDTQPEPICVQRIQAGYSHMAFGCVGFGLEGYNPCNVVGVEQSSWGAVKSLYQ